jgi:hypothetical protein
MCDQCIPCLSTEYDFISNDCAIGGGGGGECSYFETCKLHKISMCSDCDLDSGCTHCRVCIATHVINVSDELLSIHPFYKDNETRKFEWTTFDLCTACRYPVCYLYTAKHGTEHEVYMDSSRDRLHEYIYSEFQQ